MPQKKYVVTKLYTDATGMNDAAMAAYQAFMRAVFAENNFARIDFEVIEEGEEDPFTRLLQSVRSEFAVLDQAEAEKPGQEGGEGTDGQH